MMALMDLLKRVVPPQPWAEGDNIPWHEPGFSARMLREHLSQEHDAASRRQVKIDRQAQWIHETVLNERLSRILDLGCGPGFYALRFARLGHHCQGIDFSPASIDYADQQARRENVTCAFQLADIRKAEYGSGFDMVLLIFGEFNVFRPADARRILRKAHAALNDGGLLLLEPHRFETIRRIARQRTSWYTAAEGLFSERPYLCLEENFWDEAQSAATTRFHIVDLASGDIQRHAQSFQAYTDEQYQAVLNECGFAEVTFYPSLMGIEDPDQPDFLALVARRQA